jgi:signal transduction histidine kinase
MEEQEQPFAAFVLEVLMGRSPELERQWASCAQLATLCVGDPTGNTTTMAQIGGDVTAHFIRTVLAAAITAARGVREHRSLTHFGRTVGAEAHRRAVSLHVLLKELDILSVLLLGGAEEIAREELTHGTSSDGLRIARCITEVTSQLRLAAVVGYTEAISDELRERYRAIRHDLRNPLGTIKSAVALLTDETIPAETRESGRVRAMVVRNTSSLDQLIDEVLGDTAAQLRAFDAPRELTAELTPNQLRPSAREKRDDVVRPRESPDLEPGTL